jgi:serpin B
LQSATTQFSFDLLSTVLDSADAGENVLVSPTSVAIALAMAQNGAAGETRTAIADTLRIHDADLDTINAFYASLLSQVEVSQTEGLQDEEGDVQLAIANSLWAREDVTFKPSFLNPVEDAFNADITPLDFTRPDARDTINQWVSDQTRGRIPQIINAINPEDVMFLINAVYFKGSWTMEFDPEQTSDRPFTLLDGSDIQHPRMTQTDRFRYLETDDVQAIQLPYGDDRRFSMVIWLPAPSLPWSDFLATLTADQWKSQQSQFMSRQGTSQLPRFTMEDSMVLNDVLRSMGMAIAFDPDRADFSNLSDTRTVITQVNHRTFMEVNEEGTEAAASTSVGFSTTSIEMPVEPFAMIVDRPFALGLYDTETNVFLFLGTIVDPS